MKPLLLVSTVLLLCSCGPVQISSQNEPSDDAAAFNLAGITHEPRPSIVFRSFEAGMDDNMRLVFDLPKEELEAFWRASPFADQQRKRLQPHREGAGILDQPRLPDGAEPEWVGWRLADQGWYAEAVLPQARHERIFVTLDGESGQCRCYLFWHET